MRTRERGVAVLLVLLVCGLMAGAGGWPAEVVATEGQAAVKRDKVAVYAQMATTSKVVTTLKRGAVVTVDFTLAGPGGGWCHVTVPGWTKGYVRCQDLEREQAPRWQEATAHKRSAIRTWLALSWLGFFDETDREGKTALILAAENGDTRAVKTLIAQGADVNAKTRLRGNTALMFAAAFGGAAMVQELLAAGADVNAVAWGELLGEPFGYRHTALMIAASLNHTVVVRLLLAAGADLHAGDIVGTTALMYAAQAGNTPNVQALLAAGADVNARAETGHTALMSAMVTGNNLTVQTLLAAGADVHSRGIDGATALMLAASGGHTDIVLALLAAGADVHLKTSYGHTALSYAKCCGHTAIVGVLKKAGAREEPPTETNTECLYMQFSLAFCSALF